MQQKLKVRYALSFGVPVELVIIDAEHFFEEIRVFLDRIVCGEIHVAENAGVFAGHLKSVNLAVTRFAVSEKAGCYKYVFDFHSDLLNRLESAQVPIKPKYNRIQEETLVAVFVDDEDVGAV